MTNRIGFKGQSILLEEDQRRGVCNRFRYVAGTIHPMTRRIYHSTELHHMEYDENNPLAHTIELCWLCHRRVKWYDYGFARLPKYLLTMVTMNNNKVRYGMCQKVAELERRRKEQALCLEKKINNPK
jgi:hypothetical protein